MLYVLSAPGTNDPVTAIVPTEPERLPTNAILLDPQV